MRYSFEHYDSHGYLKASLWLWLGWLFLARAWVVFVVAGVSRENGPTILRFIYPDTQMLYLGLVAGIPSLLLMWLIHLRHIKRWYVWIWVGWGRTLTLLTLAVQWLQTLYHVYLQHGAFQWANALTLLILLWFFLYLARSQRVKDCFDSFSSSAHLSQEAGRVAKKP
ncbi:DUF2919 domain-containing protein [Vibrio cincinnatiensis]|uniref:DUF2919 domain-containing protein n=1 Tax=Vibrio cincinnatiensis TaxID=675 RepID=UPI0013023C3E|nr:DUF2919 domain-containing protein [Vibrio cincinnatiensis]MCG3721580.1 DUF2919 domain-containing protein [Vibrio cincinnatiensis]MCG3732435.1 DUF2919 domain-containing protein [Vibrio cincinnatiensis]MCG3736542.1 DUF2919 domain-containing protein [Vibrio cincinnatiensis]MCG3738524.1 DUF2919 domain-containing protein [Vibrio cincinnatiensis]